jgi:hypothetical protein
LRGIENEEKEGEEGKHRLHKAYHLACKQNMKKKQPNPTTTNQKAMVS